MLQLFLKNKIAVIMCTAIVGIAALMLGTGINLGNAAKIKFPQDGYIAEVLTGENGVAAVLKNQFTAQTQLRKNASDEMTFTNTEQQKITVSQDSFIHYADQSISSVNGMIMTELSEFEDGMMDSFYLDGMLSLQYENGVYKIQNNTETMKFENFLLKTGNLDYILVSPKFEITVNNEVIVVESGMLEIHYQDADGLVVSATDGDSAWQILTNGNMIEFENGTVMELDQMEVHSSSIDPETGDYVSSFSMVELVVGPQNAIVVHQDKWNAPTFVINSVDGEDGKTGEEGQSGEEGEEGEEGDEGDEGERGNDGIAGQSGKKGMTGNRGLPGKDGQDTDEDDLDVMLTPSVNITSWEQTAGSVDFKLCSYNTELLQEGTTEAYILNTASGAVESSWAHGMELKEYENDESSWRIDSLQPNTEYKLVISGMVLKTENDENRYAKSILLSRIFTTDANGLYLKKVHAGYVTEDNIAGYDNKAVAGTACLGFQVKLPGKQELSEITDVRISYIDKNSGAEVTLTGVDNPFTDSKEKEALKATAETGGTYYLHNLESNTDYTVIVDGILANGNVSQTKDTYRTLKATPVVTQAMFNVNANRYFISSATLFKDDDQALDSYEHKIYRYYSGTGMTGDCLKTKKTKNPEAYIYLSGQIHEGKDELGVDYEYGNRIYITWFDNEKYVTKEVPQGKDWKAQHIADSAEAYIQFNEKTGGITKNKIEGDLIVNSGSGQKIFVGDKDVHRILVQITSSGFTKILYYSDLSEWYDDNDMPITGTTIQGRAKLPLLLDNLAPGTTYTITVSAYFDETTSESRNVGSTVVKTLE